VTKYFAQGRDLSKPLVEVPAASPWYQRVALRLYGGYVWFAFALGVFAVLVTLLVILLS
jgi:hypothetical protein